MTKSVNVNLFAIKLFSTNGATKNEVVRALIFASRSNYVFLNPFVGSLVIELSIGNGIAAEFVATYCTVNYFIVRTVFGAVRSNLVFNNCFACVMTKCVYFFLSNLVVASGAMRAFSKTCFCASRSYCLINYHIVTKCVYFFLCNAVVASCTVRTCGKTCFCASRSYCCIVNHIVTESCNFFLCNLVVASCAVRTCGKTCFCASRSYCCIVNHIVTESGKLCSRSFIVATFAYAFLITCAAGFCTIWLNLRNVFNSVTKCGNFFLCNLVVTSCAILACGETC